MNTLSDMQKVYQMLSDEESRFTWLNRMNYLITGDMKYINKIIDTYLPELPVYGSKTAKGILSEIPSDRYYVLFGAGAMGAEVLHDFKNDKRFIGFCSSTVEKQKNGFLGYPVISPEELLRRKNLAVIVSAGGAEREILKILSTGCYPEDLVFTLDGFQPSFNEQYFGPAFLHYEEDGEVFVDAGCFNLRTSLKLREKCGKVKKVYAFEPDPKNYETCLKNKEQYYFPEAEILASGVWSETKTLCFKSSSSEGSCVSDEGDMSILVKGIDEVVDGGNRITFIKMDIEGAELEALKGARRTIQRDKPKLAICIYHKPEDMMEIPLYIGSLVPEYKFYVRHHSNYHGETVLYAVMP